MLVSMRILQVFISLDHVLSGLDHACLNSHLFLVVSPANILSLPQSYMSLDDLSVGSLIDPFPVIGCPWAAENYSA